MDDADSSRLAGLSYIVELVNFVFFFLLLCWLRVMFALHADGGGGNDADDDDEKMCINREANGGIMTQSADERVNT